MATRRAWAVGLAAASLLPGAASAQPAPARPASAPAAGIPIRYVVPFAPGSGNDLLARRMGQLLAESLRQPVVIENQPGAGGIIGIAQVVRAAPNGLTIGMGSTSTLAIGPYLQKEAPYDPVRDLAPVTLLASSPYVIAVHPRVPGNSLAELVTHARANRGRLNYS